MEQTLNDDRLRLTDMKQPPLVEKQLHQLMDQLSAKSLTDLVRQPLRSSPLCTQRAESDSLESSSMESRFEDKFIQTHESAGASNFTTMGPNESKQFTTDTSGVDVSSGVSTDCIESRVLFSPDGLGCMEINPAEQERSVSSKNSDHIVPPVSPISKVDSTASLIDYLDRARSSDERRYLFQESHDVVDNSDTFNTHIHRPLPVDVVLSNGVSCNVAQSIDSSSAQDSLGQEHFDRPEEWNLAQLFKSQE